MRFYRREKKMSKHYYKNARKTFELKPKKGRGGKGAKLTRRIEIFGGRGGGGG